MQTNRLNCNRKDRIQTAQRIPPATAATASKSANLPEAYQHTLCYQTLILVSGYLTAEAFHDPAHKEIRERLEKVSQWSKQASAALRAAKPKPSAGAAREVDKRFETIGAGIDALRKATGDGRKNDAWAVWFNHAIAADILVQDCLNTCKHYTKGKPYWRYLAHHVKVLADSIQHHYPETAEQGFDLYMQIAPEIGA